MLVTERPWWWGVHGQPFSLSGYLPAAALLDPEIGWTGTRHLSVTLLSHVPY